jgi:hypothetical protein
MTAPFDYVDSPTIPVGMTVTEFRQELAAKKRPTLLERLLRRRRGRSEQARPAHS